jgi:hypothetical protein
MLNLAPFQQLGRQNGYILRRAVPGPNDIQAVQAAHSNYSS